MKELKENKASSVITLNEFDGDPSTTPALRATPPVPGGELLLLLLLLQFIHNFTDRAYSNKGSGSFYELIFEELSGSLEIALLIRVWHARPVLPFAGPLHGLC